MKNGFLIMALVCVLLLVACGEKPATPPTLTIVNETSAVLSGFTAGEQELGEKSGTLTMDDPHKIPVVWVGSTPLTMTPKENPLEYDISFNMDKSTELKVQLYAMEDRPESSPNIEKVLNYATHMIGDYYIYTENKEIRSSDLSPLGIRFVKEHGVQDSIVYRGMPYNLGLTSQQAFNLDSIGTVNGILDGEDCTITKIDNSHYINMWYGMYGASCADVVLYSWAQVSGKLRITAATEMTPQNGSWKVGTYNSTVHGDNCESTCVCQTSSPHLVGTYVDTKADCDANTEKVMYDAYTLLRPADACTNGGHAILISEMHIERNKDGTINGDYSYVRYHDTHGAAQDTGEVMEMDGEEYEIHTCCTYNGKKSFAKLFQEGYLPVTCKQLLTPEEVVTPQVTDSLEQVDKDSMFAGTVSANNPISHVVMVITDGSGKEVQKAVRYWTDNTSVEVARFASEYHEWASDDPVYTADNTISLENLSAGNYHCTLTVHLCNGYWETVRDFDFSI